MLRRTKGGRDSNREPFPIPANVYAKISAERVRPPLAPTLWRVETANDPSLLAIAHAIATAFIDATKGSTSSDTRSVSVPPMGEDVLMRVINPLLKDDTEFYKQFVRDESFERFVTETVLQINAPKG